METAIQLHPMSKTIHQKDLQPACSDGPAVSTALPSHGRDLPITATDLPKVEFSHYVSAQSTISNNRITTTTTCQIFCLDAKALIRLFNQQSALSPKPLVHIKGHQYDYGPEYGETYATPPALVNSFLDCTLFKTFGY